MRYLDQLKRLNNMVYVSCHGAVGDTTAVTNMMGYLKTLKQITSIVKNLAGSNEAITPKIPEAYKDWHLAVFFAYNVQAAIEQERAAAN